MKRALLEFRSRHGVPAVGAAIVDRSGDVVVDVTGVRRRGGGDAVSEDDAWHIGSCGKSMTAVLYARLVERGDARWGEPLAALLTDVAAEIDPGWDGITIDQVLLHRGGLRADLSRSALDAAYRDDRLLRDQRTEAVVRAMSRPPAGPGRFRYSNLGYIVVGAAIERITATTFEDALTAHVLEPLGIKTAGFGPPGEIRGHGGRLPGAGRVGLVVGRGRSVDSSQVASDNPPVMAPAGRLHLTLEDWAAFQHVFLADGARLLTAESVDRLLAPGSGRPPNQAMGWAPAQLSNASVGQQGSNTYWVATALVDRTRMRTAMVVCNDGRTRLLSRTARLADDLLARTRSSRGR